MEPIVNRVAESDIEVFNLESIVEFDSIVSFDISPFLDRGIIVREKEFRQHVRDFDWSILQDKHVALNCSTDAIVPSWAYMLVAIRLNEVAATVYQGTELDLIRHLFRMRLESFDWSQYQDKIVVVKGCGSQQVPEDAYLAAGQYLTTVAKKIMYGEPCSSVPLWRKKSGSPDIKKTARPVSPASLPGKS